MVVVPQANDYHNICRAHQATKSRGRLWAAWSIRWFNYTTPMPQRFRFSFGLVLLVATTSGCGPPYTESLVSPDVRVRVIHPDTPNGSRGKTDGARGISAEVFYWEGPGAGEVEVVIDNGRLFVDGRGFGTVKQNDLVIIDALNGKGVTVNGKTREPDANERQSRPTN